VVVDASAVLAILLREEDWHVYHRKLVEQEKCWISPVNWWEVHVRASVLEGERGVAAAREILQRYRIEVAEIGPMQAEIAFEAYRRYRGRPAKLNLGDCFAYALAKSRGEGLLYKGEDFGVTDVNGTRLE